MKKIFLGVVFMLLLFSSKAQNLSVNYTKEFVSDSKSYFTNNKFVPYEVSGISIAYSQALKKLPLVINVTAAHKSKRPPGIVILQDPPIIVYRQANNIEADSLGTANSKSSSIDLLAGAGYILPHKENSRFIVTVNADFGVAFNNNQALNFYFRGKKTGAVEVEKTQLIINPNLKATYFFSKNVGLNLIAGYNNRGGVNAGAGMAINLSQSKKTCWCGSTSHPIIHIKPPLN